MADGKVISGAQTIHSLKGSSSVGSIRFIAEFKEASVKEWQTWFWAISFACKDDYWMCNLKFVNDELMRRFDVYISEKLIANDVSVEAALQFGVVIEVPLKKQVICELFINGVAKAHGLTMPEPGVGKFKRVADKVDWFTKLKL